MKSSKETKAETKKVTIAPSETKAVKPKTAKKPAKTSLTPVAHGIGRRKSCSARVWLRKGKGNMSVNGLPYDQYFDTEISCLEATKPFQICKEASNYDVEVNIIGGGKRAQADAIKLGFARALVTIYENLRPVLRDHKLLTVDSRVKERKKYGQKAARRKFQFVKR